MALDDIVAHLLGIVWSPALVGLCLLVGLYFSVRTRFIQLRGLPEMLKLMFQGRSSAAGVSSFQALSLSLSSRVGVGNIAGVATAIVSGGPGALFWIWVYGFVATAIKFAEAVLGMTFRETRGDTVLSGPMYYLRDGFRSPALAWIFALVAAARHPVDRYAQGPMGRRGRW